MFIQYQATNNVITDNAFVAGPRSVFVYDAYASNTGNKMDRNVYISTNSSADASWTWQNQEYSDYDEYRSASGNDENSFYAEVK